MNAPIIPKAPGDIDTSFGIDGLAPFPVDLRIIKTKILNDGNILTCGAEEQGASIWLVRHLPTGQIDTSFGEQGTVRINPPHPGQAGALNLWPMADDSVLVTAAMGSYLTSLAVVFRMLPNGEMDSDFGVSGYCTLHLGKPGNTISDAVLPSDGKVVLHMTTSDPDDMSSQNYLVRLDNGHLDPSFGDSGSGLVAVGNGEMIDFLLLANGSFLQGTIASGFSALIFRQYLPDGKPDPAFGNGGETRLAIENGQIEAFEMLLQPDDRIVVVGSAELGLGIHCMITRLDPDGSMDMTFNGGEPKIMVFQGYETQGIVVALQADGKLVIGGQSIGTVETHNFVLMRFTANGGLDGSFGNNGQVMTDYGGMDSCRMLAVQEDGNLLAAVVNPMAAQGRFYLLTRYFA
ncbi:MAG: hypothetical protein LBJ37_24955 [Paucimonas sp.]|jgi:uncharacterized delta-60 repeat protein|nr:hypothetical protein [Paucimonas sp.]